MNSLRLHAGRDESTPIDRRTFLKVMSAAGAGLTLGIFAADSAAQTSGPGKTTGAAQAACEHAAGGRRNGRAAAGKARSHARAKRHRAGSRSQAVRGRNTHGSGCARDAACRATGITPRA